MEYTRLPKDHPLWHILLPFYKKGKYYIDSKIIKNLDDLAFPKGGLVKKNNSWFVLKYDPYYLQIVQRPLKTWSVWTIHYNHWLLAEHSQMVFRPDALNKWESEQVYTLPRLSLARQYFLVQTNLIFRKDPGGWYQSWRRMFLNICQPEGRPLDIFCNDADLIKWYHENEKQLDKFNELQSRCWKLLHYYIGMSDEEYWKSWYQSVIEYILEWDLQFKCYGRSLMFSVIEKWCLKQKNDMIKNRLSPDQTLLMNSFKNKL